jgi:hypothetical protein
MMEVPDGNGEHIVDENEEETLNEIAGNDSCPVDLEAINVIQEPYIGMEFDSQENAYSFYTQYKCVAVQRFLESLLTRIMLAQDTGRNENPRHKIRVHV